MNKEQFIEALIRYFGLTEALRSDESFEVLRNQIQDALNEWSGRPATEMYVLHTFPDRVIAFSWSHDDGSGWEIPYSRDGEGAFEFGTPIAVNRVMLFEPVAESLQGDKQRLVERISQRLAPMDESAGVDGARRVMAIGVTADVVNGNGRRYRRPVLAAAIARLNSTLNESAGQGRLILTGEAEHPSDKGKKPNILETVVKWEAASLDAGGQVLLEGVILPTSKGRDVGVLVDHKVPIDVSQRAYGSFKTVEESGQSIQDVDYLEITGYDLVKEGSDPNARLLESIDEQDDKGERAMSLEELLALLAEKPELLEALKNRMALADRNSLAESLGVEPEKLDEAVKTAAAAQTELAERDQREAVDAAIVEATAELKYGELNADFIEAVRKSEPSTPEAVGPLVEAKRVEYDAILAKAQLARMGKSDVQVLGPVFERETGKAEFLLPAHEISEAMAVRDVVEMRNIEEDQSRAAKFARRYLAAFDEAYRRELIAEMKLLDEAEQTTDLNLPYSVSRSIIEAAVPELVSANVFDFGVADASPTRIYFEAYAAESGAAVAITDEDVTSDEGAWVDLAHKRVRPGTVVIEPDGGGTAFVENTDYLVDYADGRLYTLASGTIGDATDLDVDYTYESVREGEMAAIQRGKATLSFQTVELAADRLAQQISDEAVVFARTQLGWDATTRTLAMLVREIRQMIDEGCIRLAIAQARIAANAGGTWTSATDPLSELVEKLGVAKIAIQTDNYDPQNMLSSLTNADLLENYFIEKTASMAQNISGARGVLGAGDTGIRIKGLPLFASKLMPDSTITVQHRELVQHRVLSSKPMMFKGPFPSYSSGNLVAADQYYIEEYNGTWGLVPEKGGHVNVA